MVNSSLLPIPAEYPAKHPAGYPAGPSDSKAQISLKNPVNLYFEVIVFYDLDIGNLKRRSI